MLGGTAQVITQPINMFYEAFYEYKNESVFIKLMEEIQNMECSYFKSECYNIPSDCEKIDEHRFRRMLKKARILYNDISDYAFANILFSEAFGPEKKCRYYKDEINNIKCYLYAKSIDFILKNKMSSEVQPFHAGNVQNSSLNLAYMDFGTEFCLHFQSGISVSYQDKIIEIESIINNYYDKVTKNSDKISSDDDFSVDMSFNPKYRETMLTINNNIEDKANAPLTNDEIIAICNYKLFEINYKNNSIFDFAKFKSKQNTFNNFREIMNLLSFDLYCGWVKDLMESEEIKELEIEQTFSKLSIEKIWDCVIVDVMINSYINICIWNNGEQFNCSFESLFHKFDEDYIHYTSTEYDIDAPLVKKIIDDNIAPKSKVKYVMRIRDTFKKIDPYGYISKFFERLPNNMKNLRSTQIPEFSMAIIFGLLMYKYSFGNIKSTASDVSCCKLCECMNCYTDLISRNTFAQEINKRDDYKAQCFLEKYLLNMIYNINGIVSYLNCNFATNKLRESYYNKLVCNRYILTYQKLCSLQNNIDLNITYFMNNEILNKYIDIVTYMLTSVKVSSIESYQNIINSFKMYLINDSQSPKDLIQHKIYMNDESSNLSADDYAKIFGFNYYNTPKKRNKNHSKNLHMNKKSSQNK